MKSAELDFDGGEVIHWILDDFNPKFSPLKQLSLLKEDLIQVKLTPEIVLDV